MVILEARTLGLPVVTTAFSSVGDSVPGDAGIVVPQTVGVAHGLRRFLAGKVPAHALDGEEYNRRRCKFCAAIGAEEQVVAGADWPSGVPAPDSSVQRTPQRPRRGRRRRPAPPAVQPLGTDDDEAVRPEDPLFNLGGVPARPILAERGSDARTRSGRTLVA